MCGKTKKKIGIMGGTFDPIHYGHLLIAESAADEFKLDEVIFLPTGKSPHKDEILVREPALRCDMVALAVEDNPKFSVSFLEATSTEVNYTYRTLQKFHVLYPGAEIYFIMGEDSLNDFDTWKNPEEICKQAVLLVAIRNELGNEITEKIKEVSRKYQGNIHMLHAPNFMISSRDIRKRVQKRQSIHYLVPTVVEEYIHQNFLYMEQ